MTTIRKWLDENSGVVIVALVVVLAASISFIVFWMRRPADADAPKAQQVFYYDMSNQSLFPGSNAQVPPIMAPSGPGAKGEMTGVRAHVFSCGSCDEKDRYVAWLDMYTPEAQQKLAPRFGPNRSAWGPTSPEDLEGTLAPGEHLLAAGSGAAWVASNTPEANRLTQDALKPCPSGERPHECHP